MAAPTDAAGRVLSDRSVSWATSAPTIATVANGVVSAVAPGSASITATSEGRSGTATITVTPIPIATLSVTPASCAVVVGGSCTLTASARDAAGGALTGRPVTWSTAAATIATVSASGGVTAIAAGTTTITATAEGRSATATVTVTPVPVASVVITPATPTIRVGATLQLIASARDSAGGALTGRAVTWQSNATAVANISTAGVVSAVAPGTATMTASVEGRTASTVVTVERAPVGSISLTASSLQLYTDSMAQLTATVRDDNGNTLTDRTVTWSTSAPTVVQVNASGRVGGIGPGTATVTATAEGKSASVAVTVSSLLTLRMYYSASLTGPWQFKTVVISNGDALEVVDPSPVLMPDGRILLYYLMNNTRSGDPATSQPNNQWKMGVAESTNHGESFVQRGTAFTASSSITDPFPMVLADGRIRMLYAQTVASNPSVFSATSADATGLTFPYTSDAGTRSSGASIPGALRIGSTYYLYACGEGITYATSTDGLTFGTRSVAIPPSSAGIICDPSPITVGANSYAMAFKTRPMGVPDPRSDTTYIATSTNGTTWTRQPTAVGPGSVPGMVRDQNGIYRIYVVYFPPR